MSLYICIMVQGDRQILPDPFIGKGFYSFFFLYSFQYFLLNFFGRETTSTFRLMHLLFYSFLIIFSPKKSKPMHKRMLYMYKYTYRQTYCAQLFHILKPVGALDLFVCMHQPTNQPVIHGSLIRVFISLPHI